MAFLRERSGAFSPEKIVAFLFVLAPLGWLAARALSGGLTPADPFGVAGGALGGGGLGGGGALGADPALAARPLVEALRYIGEWSIRILLVTLAVTPARRLFNWPRLLAARRTLGLGAAFYVVLHVGFYAVDIGDLGMVVREIVLRIYLTIGFVAFIGLLALSATSWDGAVQRLGSARWNQIHMMVYPITALGLLHFFIQQKLDVTEPTLMTGLFLWLIYWRIAQRLQHGTGLIAMIVVALAAGLSTALVEAGWYLAATGIDPWRVLNANLAFSYSIRPAWWVFGTGIVIALASEIVLRLRPLPARRPGRAQGTSRASSSPA